MSIPSSVSKAFAQLRASSNTVVLEALLVIRKFIGTNIHNVKLIREKNVLQELVNNLGKPNEKILDVTLSILGNCCLENECRIQLFHLGIVRAVVIVLNSTSRDAIQGRACRLIGNLALTHNIAIKLHKENVINSLVNVLDCGGNNSIATQQMAVRALRVLWAVESERATMLELNVIRRVTVLLTIPYEKRYQKDILKTVVKALSVFTHHCSEQCAAQVHADTSVLETLLSFCTIEEMKSSVVMCIYNLCQISSSRPILGSAGIVKVIVRELSALDPSIAELTESQCALISSLCLLCRESVNRAKIRREGGLSIILSTLRHCPKTSLQKNALHALVLFVYDERSLQVLLKEGLVNVLVTRLSNFVAKHGCEHEHEYPKVVRIEKSPTKKRHISSVCCSAVKNKNDEENSCESGKNEMPETIWISDTSANCENWKKFRINSPSYQAVIQEFGSMQRCRENTGSTVIPSPSHSGEYLFRMSSPEQCVERGSDSSQMGEWSPGSPRSMCFSPESSPSYGRPWNYSPTYTQTSPFDMWSSTSSPVSHTSIDVEIPEVYSPICHDTQSDEDSIEDNKCECTRSHNSEETLEEQITGSPSIADSPSADCEVLSVASSSGGPYLGGEEADLLILLSRISHMETVIEDLVFKNTLTTLLNYIRLLRSPLPRAGRILGRIVRTHHYFIHLICQQFVLKVYTSFCQPLHSTCVLCEKLNTIGKNLISKLSIVAESGFGEGELAHYLLKAEMAIRETIAVTVPFVIKSHKLLRKLLIDCKGLDILQSMIKAYCDDPGFFLGSLPVSLSLIAESLQIRNPVDPTKSEKQDCPTKALRVNFENMESGNCVMFKLDNGDIVSASKTFLTEHSPVFEAMLQGRFKESEQECISLVDISSDAFTHLLYVMKLGKLPNCLPSLTIPTALELLLILDRFLISGSNELAELIVNQFLQPCSACDVYFNVVMYCGVLKVFDDLRKKTIEYVLVSDMNMKSRRDLFTKLLSAPCSHQVQADVYNILHERLYTKYR